MPPSPADSRCSAAHGSSARTASAVVQDFICNHLGNKAWTLQLDWPGRELFSAAPDKPWYAPRKPGGAPEHAGDLRTAKGFSFLRVFDAGHLAPMDQPRATLTMLDAFIQGKL